MACHMDTTDLTTFLECSICLDQYDNPKLLTCAHNFCKTCIENIMKFNTDGSASIVCPLRCTENTIIGEDQTVNDLKGSYDIKYILEALKQKGKKSAVAPICAHNNSCGEPVSVFFLRTLMCTKCYELRNKVECGGADKVSLAFDKTTNRLHVYCEDHSCLSSHVCSDGKFLCMYCLHRNKNHIDLSKNTIVMEVTSLKETLNNLVKENKRILDFQHATEEAISETKMEIYLVLEKRRATSCLESTVLIAEEEKMREKFDNLCDNHMKQYQNEAQLRLSDYFENMSGKSEIEILLLRKEVLMQAQEYHNAVHLEIEEVFLQEVSDPLHPLGALNVSKTGCVQPDNSPSSTFRLRIVAPDSQGAVASACSSSILTEEYCITSSGVDSLRVGDEGKDDKFGNGECTAKKKKKKKKKKKNIEQLESAHEADSVVAPNNVAPLGTAACFGELLKSKICEEDDKDLDFEKEKNEIKTSKKKKKKKKKKKISGDSISEDEALLNDVLNLSMALRTGNKQRYKIEDKENDPEGTERTITSSKKKKTNKEPSGTSESSNGASISSDKPPTLGAMAISDKPVAPKPAKQSALKNKKHALLLSLYVDDRPYWLVDCYRLRVDEDMSDGTGGKHYHGLYLDPGERVTESKMKLSVIKDFLAFMILGATKGLIPEGRDLFSFEECLEYAADCLRYGFEACDAALKWLTPVPMRQFAVEVYGSLVKSHTHPNAVEGEEIYIQVKKEVDNNVKKDFRVIDRRMFDAVGGYRIWERLYRTMRVGVSSFNLDL